MMCQRSIKTRNNIVQNRLKFLTIATNGEKKERSIGVVMDKYILFCILFCRFGLSFWSAARQTIVHVKKKNKIKKKIIFLYILV